MSLKKIRSILANLAVISETKIGRRKFKIPFESPRTCLANGAFRIWFGSVLRLQRTTTLKMADFKQNCFPLIYSLFLIIQILFLLSTHYDKYEVQMSETN